MKITKTQLKQIIKEELTAVLAEEEGLPFEWKRQPFTNPEQAQRDRAATTAWRGVMAGDIRVKEGDTLWDLWEAGKFRGASIDDVIAFNDIDPKNLEVGSTIKLPPAAPPDMDTTIEMGGPSNIEGSEKPKPRRNPADFA
jgi:hypothetical protein